MKRKIFVDTETTGLNPMMDDLVEVSWAVEDGPIKTLFFGVQTVPDHIDELIGFTSRGLALMPSADESDKEEFKNDLRNNTMVAANPSFDEGFLMANDLWTAHYRKLDIESFAAGKLDLVEVPSMREVYLMMIERGFKIEAPNHTSRRDVECMRQVYRILRYM